MLKIEDVLAKELGVKPSQVEAVIKLIDEGNTIPFIARYRKEATGGLDDAQLRELDARLTYLRTLEARKAEVLASIDEQGKLTEELRDAIEGATMMQRVEDLYKPFKKKRATRASKARAAGLEPLANMIMLQATTSGDPLVIAAEYVNAEGGYATAEAALAGAQDIVAEVIADDAENTDALRAFTNNTGAIGVEAVDADEKTVYEAYYDFSEPVSKIPNHRILAINRGETEGKLRVRVRVDQQQAIDLLGSRIARRHNINTIVIGNGTASRETEEVVSDFISESDLDLRYTIVNEAGASVYSASKLASEEYPDLDVTTRGAMSLGRRLQDPLAEMVKIPPQSIGVGQYQHDLNQVELGRALGGVVERVVNQVGVDLNTASASLLGYVSGITPTIAKNIVAYREEMGAFTDRRQLKKVPKLGPKAFLNCAGFLRISGGTNPLDATSVHPESYAVATALLERTGVEPSALARGGVADMARRVGNIGEVARELDCGVPTLRDIVSELEKPGRDPRDDAPEVVFSRSVTNFDDLKVGMELTGTVRNVVDFGAFVDIGVKQDGLVHISKMANRFVKHPSDIVSVGDTVTVWICGIDKDRGKISLTMVEGK